jgi:hypothetical protein
MVRFSPCFDILPASERGEESMLVVERYNLVTCSTRTRDSQAAVTKMGTLDVTARVPRDCRGSHSLAFMRIAKA